LLNFEGDPALSIAERRKKQSPLKDVAGMLRSFSYVAHSALEQYAGASLEASDPIGRSNLAAWAVQWQEWASAAYFSAYSDAIAANPTLLPSPPLRQDLLHVYILEKALNELLYELNNRPAWIRIPIEGILRLSQRSNRSEGESEA